jgi:uncharacterized protein (DUF58 family)
LSQPPSKTPSKSPGSFLRGESRSTFEPRPLPQFLTQLPEASLIRRIAARILHNWTPGGRLILLFLCPISLIAAGYTLPFSLYYVAFFLFALAAIDGVIGRFLLPRLQIERLTGLRCAAGATIQARARVTNTGRWPAYDLAIREEAKPARFELPAEVPLHPCLLPGESVVLSAPFRPARRGAYELVGPTVLSAFPFGLYFNKRSGKQPERLLVTPSFVPLDAIRIPAGTRHQPGGMELVSQVGESMEFVGNREYRSGDRLRDIHHMAWARVGRPVVREFQQEYLTRIALAVDTYSGSKNPSAKEIKALEAAISLAASVADALSRQEYVIDLFAAGPELYHFQAGRHLAFLDDVLDVLACIEGCPEDPFPKLGPAVAESLAQISTAVVVFLDWDETRRDFVRMLHDSGVQTLVMVVRDGDPSLDPAGFTTASGPVRTFTTDEVEAGVGSL